MEYSTHHLLMRAHLLLKRRILSHASALGLLPGQPKVLEFLKRNGGKNQKAIAEHCLIEQATVGSLLTRMEQAGLVERRQARGDRRSLHVHLTKKGLEMADRADAIFAVCDAEALRGMSEEDAATLAVLLSRMGHNLDEEKEEQV